MKKGDFSFRGFTIVEVSLVLGIAGLIFLMIFIALPALQRQSRDTARKEDINELITAIKKYQTNNRGALPTGTGTFSMSSGGAASTWGGFLQKYMDSYDFVDPDGPDYVLSVSECSGQANGNCTGSAKGAIEDVTGKTFESNGFKIYVILQAKCTGNESTGAVGSSNPRKLAVLYKLEGGGVYCEET